MEELDWKFGQVFGDKTTVDDVADGSFSLLFLSLLFYSLFILFFLVIL
jgi:hypothetical protein